MILFCTCTHDFQDHQYGPQRRVHNPVAKSSTGSQTYRCTVCQHEQSKAQKTKEPAK